ncbi:MAG: hypothetical protein ACKO2L_15430 [Planctomycetaceae bacterium]
MLVSRVIVAEDQIIDVLTAAGLKQPDISIPTPKTVGKLPSKVRKRCLWFGRDFREFREFRTSGFIAIWFSSFLINFLGADTVRDITLLGYQSR